MRFIAALLATLAVAVTACDEDGEPAAPAPTGWERVVPGGDCECSDGSEFSFWVRKADPKKVVIYFQDGGVCFSAKTCAPANGGYNTSVGMDEGPSGEGGIFDFADERNPFADHSVIFVPYCTGDAHLGDATTRYTPRLTVHHKGYVNGTAALEQLAATFPRATDVAVVGESAGSVAAPLYAGLVSDRLPQARITALADASGSYPDAPAANRIIAAWGTGEALPNWPGGSAKPWTFPGLFIRSGRHDPDIVFARHNYAYDENQRHWYPIAGIRAPELLSLIDRNERQIERAGVKLNSYTAPGSRHTVLTKDELFTEEVNGEPLVDWVARLIARKPVEDVHCDRCRARKGELRGEL